MLIVGHMRYGNKKLSMCAKPTHAQPTRMQTIYCTLAAVDILANVTAEARQS